MMEHLPIQTFADLTFADRVRTFADPDICRPRQADICRPRHLPTEKFANRDKQTFADQDICQPRHLPTKTFADRSYIHCSENQFQKFEFFLVFIPV